MSDKAFNIEKFEKVDATKVKIKGTILWNELDKRLKEIYGELARSVRMKGFRPGRIPRSLLRKMFGKQVEPSIVSEAVREAVVEYLTERSKNEGIYYDKNSHNWEIDTPDIESGKDLEFTVELEALTEIEVKDYKDLKLTRYIVRPKDEEIEAELERMLKAAVKEIPVEEGALEKGMVISLKYMGKLGDDPIEIENFVSREVEGLDDIKGRADAMLLDFVVANLVGRDVKEITEDEFELEFDVPEDAAAEELAGKHARLLVEVSSVRRLEEPQLDDEFAKDQGYENLDDMRAKVRERLEKEKERRSRELLERQVIDQLIERNPIEIGEKLLKTYTESVAEGFLAMLGLRLDYLTDEQREDFLARYKDTAQRYLLSTVLLDAIARQEGMELGEEDIDEYLRIMAEARGESFERLKSDYEKKKDPATEELALHHKVINWLIEQAEVEEKEVEDFPEDEPEEAAEEGQSSTEEGEATEEAKTKEDE